MQPQLDRHKLQTALLGATERAFTNLMQLTQGQQAYVFGLYTNGEGTYVVPTANTEEALTEKARTFATNVGKPFEVCRAALRWSPADWTYHLAGAELFQDVEAVLSAGWTADYDTYVFDRQTIYTAGLDVLRMFRQSEVFTTTPEHEQIVLNLFIGDQSIEQRIAWAHLLNGQEVAARFRHELAETHAAFLRLSA